MKALARINKSLTAFHEEENGMEAVQVVMLVAIAALVLIALVTFGGEIIKWVRTNWTNLKSDSGSKLKG